MTVQKVFVKNRYDGNGSKKNWPITFDWDKNHQECIKVYTRVNGALSQTTNFTIQISEDTGNYEVFYPAAGNALASGDKIIIARELPLQQVLNLVNQGPFFADDIEITFDEVVMMCQQLNERLGRSLKVGIDIDSDSDIDVTIPVPTDEKNYGLRMTKDGFQLVNDPSEVYDDTVDIKNQAEAAKLSAQNAASVAQAWAEEAKILALELVTPQMYGAKADGTTDDSSAIQQAINSGKPVFFPNGTYHIETILELKNNTCLCGASRGAILDYVNQDSSTGEIGQYDKYACLNALDKDNVLIENLTIKSNRCGIKLFGCKNSVIRNIEISTSKFSFLLGQSANRLFENFIIEDIFINNSVSSVSSDGIHFDGGCSNGLVRNVVGTTGDDFLALNACEGNDGVIENIVFDGIITHNNNVRSAFGVRIYGFQDATPIKDIIFQNCQFFVSGGPVVKVLSTPNTLFYADRTVAIGREFPLGNITFENCVMKNSSTIQQAIFQSSFTIADVKQISGTRFIIKDCSIYHDHIALKEGFYSIVFIGAKNFDFMVDGLIVDNTGVDNSSGNSGNYSFLQADRSGINTNSTDFTNLSVSNVVCNSSATINSSQILSIVNSCSVKELYISNVDFNKLLYAGIYIANSTVNKLIAKNITISNTLDHSFIELSGHYLDNVYLDGIINNSNKPLINYFVLYRTSNIMFSNIVRASQSVSDITFSHPTEAIKAQAIGNVRYVSGVISSTTPGTKVVGDTYTKISEDGNVKSTSTYTGANWESEFKKTVSYSANGSFTIDISSLDNKRKFEMVGANDNPSYNYDLGLLTNGGYVQVQKVSGSAVNRNFTISYNNSTKVITVSNSGNYGGTANIKVW